MKVKNLFLLFVLVLCTGAAAKANEMEEWKKIKEDTLRVVVNSFPPCVMKDGEQLTGFDIELWEMIAAKLGLNYVYNETAKFDEIFARVRNNTADVGIAGITINEVREKDFDFSHQYLESGLRIMVPKRMKSSLFSRLNPEQMKLIGFFLLFWSFWSFVYLFAERGVSLPAEFKSALGASFWFSVVTFGTVGYGDIAPRGWKGRLVAIFMIFTGIYFYSSFTAQMAAGITIERLETNIAGPKDLRDKTVATVEGTTSVEFLQKLGAEVVQVVRVEDAFAMLIADKIDAVVFDSPALLYFAANEGKDKVTVVGNLFDRQDYGYLFVQGSPLREQVNRILLQFKKDGTYDRVHQKWFGEDH